MRNQIIFALLAIMCLSCVNAAECSATLPTCSDDNCTAALTKFNECLTGKGTTTDVTKIIENYKACQGDNAVFKTFVETYTACLEKAANSKILGFGLIFALLALLF